MDNTTGMDPDQGYNGDSHDDEDVEVEERDFDAENDYREDLRDGEY